MTIWRIHIKTAAREGISPVQFCIDKQIVGVGWPIDTDRETSLSWEKYVSEAEKRYPEDNGWWPAVRALYERMNEHDLVWTRDSSNNYYLGRITSPWHYEISQECSNANVVNVRDCDWSKVGAEDKVPAAIVNRFISSRTVQAMYNTAVRTFSMSKAAKQWPDTYKQEALSGDIFDYLPPEECEDVLAIYLQMNRNYYLVPSTCKKSTQAYEYILIDRKTGKSAAAQVKSGQVALNIDEFAGIDTNKIFLFATSGTYYGTPDPKVETIDPEVIRNFIYENNELMPEKIRFWIEQIGPYEGTHQISIRHRI